MRGNPFLDLPMLQQPQVNQAPLPDSGELQRQQFQQMNAISAPQAALQGAGDTLSFGTIPKVGGRLGAIGARLLRPELFEDETLDQTYEKSRDYLRNLNNEAAAQHPYAYGAGQIGGAFINPVSRGASTVKGAMQAAGQYGFLYGLGSSDSGNVNELNLSNILDAGKTGLESAALGGIIQKGVNVASPYASSIMQKLSDSFLPKAANTAEAIAPSVISPKVAPQAPSTSIPTSMLPSNPVGAQAERAYQLSKQFKTPISLGQATQNNSQLALEDLIASGAKGSDAAAVANAERAATQAGFQEAAANLRKDIGGGVFIDKGESLKGAVTKIMDDAASEKKAITEAYDLAKEKVGYLDIKNVKQFTNTAKAKLAEEFIDPNSAPLTYAKLNGFNTIFKDMPKGAKGIDIRRIEGYRKSLVRASQGATSSDIAGIKVLTDHLDDFLDNSIETALIHGDNTVLQQFKNARVLNTNYMKNYKSKDKTDFGKKFIRDIVEHGNNYTPAMISDKLLGASKYGFKPQTVSAVNELKGRLGVESPEFQGIKLDSVQKILKPLLNSKGEINFNNPSVQTFKNNLYEQQGYLKNILTPDEFKQLSDFGDFGSLLFQSKKSVINAPQSGLFSALAKLPFIKQALGAAEAVTGLPGIKAIPEGLATMDAKKAYNPKVIEKAISNLNTVAPVNPTTQIPGRAALAGTAMMNTSPPQEMPMNNNPPPPTPQQAAPQVASPSNPFMDIPAPAQSAPQAQMQQSSPIDNALLKKIAMIESGGNPNAKAQGSTASGMYQFTNGTWRDVVNKYGADTGISLKDKNNPEAQATMVQKMMHDNAPELQKILGHSPSYTDLYLTHFLGLGGAKKILNSNVNKTAADVLPDAARSNPTLFYANGRPLTVAQFYNKINQRVMAA